jgi:hypothetical protein
MNGLTKRQHQILEFVLSAQQAGKSAPTLREIAAHCQRAVKTSQGWADENRPL